MTISTTKRHENRKININTAAVAIIINKRKNIIASGTSLVLKMTKTSLGSLNMIIKMQNQRKNIRNNVLCQRKINAKARIKARMKRKHSRRNRSPSGSSTR